MNDRDKPVPARPGYMRYSERTPVRIGRPSLGRNKTGPSFRIAEWLHENLDERLEMTQTELATTLGYERPTMISMMKTGKSRVPLDKVGQLAEALKVDPGFLMRLALEQYLPNQDHLIDEAFGAAVSRPAKALIEQLGDLVPPEKTQLGSTQLELIGEALKSDARARDILRAWKKSQPA